MVISNGNNNLAQLSQLGQLGLSSPLNVSNLAGNPSMSSQKAPSALNAPILARVHNVRPGCGSCGRH